MRSAAMNWPCVEAYFALLAWVRLPSQPAEPDHLGDCHMALGQKKEAVAAWEKGLKAEDLSKRDAERRRKVTENMHPPSRR